MAEGGVNTEQTERRITSLAESMRNLRQARITAALATLLTNKDVPTATNKIMDITDKEIMKDSRTGFFNKEGLESHLADVLEIAQMNSENVSLLFLDGDEFKKVNDLLGYEDGDRAILHMAEAIRKTTRGDDIHAHIEEQSKKRDIEENSKEARRGGDEFVVILYGTDTKKALEIAKRMSKEISNEVDTGAPQIPKMLNRPFSVSIGIAQYNYELDNQPDESGVVNAAAAFLKRGEEAMKHSKAAKKAANYRGNESIGLHTTKGLQLAA